MTPARSDELAGPWNDQVTGGIIGMTFQLSEERQQFIREDKLALRESSARFLFESARLDVYLGFAARFVTMPVLLLLAGEDRIIDNARTAAFVSRFPGPTETVTYPSAHHTLEFERDDHPWLGDVVRWVGARL